MDSRHDLLAMSLLMSSHSMLKALESNTTISVEPGGVKPSTAGSNSLGMLLHTHLEGVWFKRLVRAMRGDDRQESLIDWGC